MPQPLAHARIPQEWEAQLRAIATETGQTYSDVEGSIVEPVKGQKTASVKM